MPRNSITGQSMTEFLIIVPIVVVLIMGAVQLVFVYQAKTTLNYATFEAARAASLENASLSAMQAGLARGMAPYFTRPGSEALGSTEDLANVDETADVTQLAADVARGHQKAKDEIAAGYVHFERINPTPEAFDDAWAYDIGGGEREIPNDHLLFRASTPGGSSGLSIQDNNLLKIRVTWCMKLIVPFVNRFFVASARTLGTYDEDAAQWHTDRGSNIDGAWGNYEAWCLSSHERTPGDYRWPVVAHAVIRMQSAPRSCPGCFEP